MIHNLAFKIIVGIFVILICVLLGYLKQENRQLREDLAHSEKTQNELLWLCSANKQTQSKVTSALLLSKEPATIDSFRGIVDILFEGEK